ncbi:MAG: hypothetical protein L6R39_000393, partial [Caloplaca ligustica]
TRSLIYTGVAGRDSEYCAILVAVNSMLQMVFFASLAIRFVKVVSSDNEATIVSYNVVAKSVAVFLGIALGASIFARFVLRKIAGDEWYARDFIK